MIDGACRVDTTTENGGLSSRSCEYLEPLVVWTRQSFQLAAISAEDQAERQVLAP